MNATVRRNDPCPCGSGQRYKECHGKLGAAPPSPQARVQRALGLHQQGQLAEAERLYREVLGEEPGHAIATHYLGLIAWSRGARGEAVQQMRAALAADATVPDFHNNLGLLMRDLGRLDEAIACYRKALEVDPGWYEALNNVGLALEAGGRYDEALAAYREALAREPRFAAAHHNLALALLARGEQREAFEHYRWRLVAQGLASTPPDARAARLPAHLEGRRFALRTEQGIGDALFFLRYAPELAARGAQLAFRGDPRLHPLLARTALFVLGLEGERAEAPRMETLFVGDLPWLLADDEAARFPAALRLEPLAGRLERWRAKLLGFGPAPHVAITWRAGTQAAGPTRVQLKEVDSDTLGQALRGRRATWISVQRQPEAGSREALERALGAPVHDASAANDDLEEILALMGAVDDYVGVSNTNTHLRAGLGGTMRVLVPFPPEWRWGLAGERSPWFAGADISRQAPDGSWDLHRR